jgi:hypothetical protein
VAVNPQIIPVFVIIGKKQLGLIIPEVCPREFPLDVSDLDPLCSQSSRASQLSLALIYRKGPQS